MVAQAAPAEPRGSMHVEHHVNDQNRDASAGPGRATRFGLLVVALLVAACTSSPSAGAPTANAPTANGAALGSPTLDAGTSGAPETSAPSTTEAPSGSPSTDVDDGATAGGAPVLSTPAATIDPTARASGRLPGEPNPVLTPGAFNPSVTQATIGSTICVSGWTATVRPPSSYTTGLKIQQIGQYGYSDTRTSSYEEDHLIPLELGGAPSDPRNLWPEPYSATLPDGRNVGARVKDGLETSLKRAVCAGSITLADARAKIGIHWVHVYYGIPLTTGATAPPVIVTPTPKVTSAPPPAPFSVTFVSLPSPAIHGSPATMTARTSVGATCAAKVTWPSGTVSAAAGLKTTPTAASDGLVSWTWNVGSTTKPGTATAAVTCTRGGTATVTATFTVQ